jgi:hypothetical protein
MTGEEGILAYINRAFCTHTSLLLSRLSRHSALFFFSLLLHFRYSGQVLLPPSFISDLRLSFFLS